MRLYAIGFRVRGRRGPLDLLLNGRSQPFVFSDRKKAEDMMQDRVVLYKNLDYELISFEVIE